MLPSWQQIAQKVPIDWLLEETNPSVRYFTLRDILAKPSTISELLTAKQAIPNSAIVQRILQKETTGGWWEEPTSPYLPKYKSSYWQIMILSQLGMDKLHEKIARACEYIFRFQSPIGGFSAYSSTQALKEYNVKRKKGTTVPESGRYVESVVHEHQYSCLTGNVTAALIRMGYVDDPRVRKALNWLVEVQNGDGGWLCPYWKAHIRDKHGCFHGTICPMEAFSEFPKERLTKEMRETVERGAEFLLTHRLFKADHHGYDVINRNWLSFTFPTFYNYNILRGLDVLTRLGYVSDERLSDAMEILLDKQRENGTWVLEGTPTGRMHANIEKKGQPSKWVTLIALRVLKRLSRK